MKLVSLCADCIIDIIFSTYNTKKYYCTTIKLRHIILVLSAQYYYANIYILWYYLYKSDSWVQDFAWFHLCAHDQWAHGSQWLLALEKIVLLMKLNNLHHALISPITGVLHTKRICVIIPRAHALGRNRWAKQKEQICWNLSQLIWWHWWIQ